MPNIQIAGGALTRDTLAALVGGSAFTATDSLTATASGTQATGVPLTTAINRVTTVATAADSVVLPLATAGAMVLVINSGTKTLQVFGAGTDTINDIATATGFAQMPGSLELYICTTSAASGKWYVEGGAGFTGSFQTLSFTAGLTAFATGGQTSAVLLPSMINRVGTVATQGDSVKLPPSAVGLEITVINRGANPMQVFGSGTDTINGIATATGISQGVQTAAMYVCTVAGNWEVPLTVLQSTFPTALTTNGAIPPHVGHVYVITKAGVLADTLAAPTATTDDGLEITITSATANAHTLTATGLLQTGTAAVNLATFAAQPGAGLTLMAYQGKWNVLSSVGIVFT